MHFNLFGARKGTHGNSVCLKPGLEHFCVSDNACAFEGFLPPIMLKFGTFHGAC